MGKIPRTEGTKRRNRKFKYDFDTQKTRHRCADTKYRTRVQYLYSKLEEMMDCKPYKNKKDKVLSTCQTMILSLENEISLISGTETLRQIRQEFLELLLYEESLWKKEKDLSKWWSRIERTF